MCGTISTLKHKTYCRISLNASGSRTNTFGKSSTNTRRVDGPAAAGASNTEPYRDARNRNCSNSNVCDSANAGPSSSALPRATLSSTSTGCTHSCTVNPAAAASSRSVAVLPAPAGPLMHSIGAGRRRRLTVQACNHCCSSAIFLAWMAKSSTVRGAKFSSQVAVAVMSPWRNGTGAMWRCAVIASSRVRSMVASRAVALKMAELAARLRVDGFRAVGGGGSPDFVQSVWASDGASKADLNQAF